MDPREVRHVLTNLVARAIPLSDRLATDRLPAGVVSTASSPPASLDDHLRKWRRVVADDNDEIFARRLAWDGLTEASIRHLLEDRGDEVGAAPAWVDVLAQAILFAAREAESSPPDGAPIGNAGG